MFSLVSLFVSRIMQKLLNQCSQNSVERWHMSHGRTQWILVVNRIVHVTSRLRLTFHVVSNRNKDYIKPAIGSLNRNVLLLGDSQVIPSNTGV